MSSKIYPIGIQNFEKIRKDGYFYIDKTALIYQMVKTGSYYFLSRPRRFGKSLLISTLEAYFLGKKELFEGLAMEKLEKDWITHWRNGNSNMAPPRRKQLLHCVFAALLNGLMSKPGSVWSF